MGSRNVVGIGRHACTSHFSVNFSSTCFGVFQFFQNQTSGTLAHNETVATCAEWARSMFRVVIPGRKGFHGIKTTYASRPYSCFRAAAEDHVSLAQTDKVECVSQSVGRRCACRSGRVVRPMETIHNRNMTACNVCNHFRDEERIVFWSQFFSCECIRPGFFFKSVYSTDSHSEDYTYTVFVHSFQIHAGIVYGHFGCSQGILGVQVHSACFFAVNVVAHIEIFHLASKLSLEQGSIEMCNRSGTTYPLNQILPSFLGRISQWSNGTHTCYHNSF